MTSRSASAAALCPPPESIKMRSILCIISLIHNQPGMLTNALRIGEGCETFLQDLILHPLFILLTSLRSPCPPWRTMARAVQPCDHRATCTTWHKHAIQPDTTGKP